MEVRCPHCHTPVALASDSPLSAIECPSCGSSFSLLGEQETAAYDSRTRTLGHFALAEQIGTGSFGSVWRAKDTELDRTVAVKIPRKGQLDPAEAELFLREARAAAQLRHPHIVSVHEVGRDGETVFIVSEYVKGVTLAEWLTAKRLSAREAAELCAKLAEALHHAHEAGVVHRDLKPSNVILDERGEPHIMDFGLARREAGEVTMTVEGRVLGTPAYMSPEQARGESHEADRRSDVYSLGVILFELLTGERPFRGSARMLLHQIIHDEAPSPRRLVGSVPRDLETICLKCLEKDADKRYTSAAALAEDLRHFLAGEPITARPISRTARGWRWCKRRPLVAVLAAGLFCSLAVGLCATSWLWARALLAAEAARQQAYMSDMNAACLALSENNFVRVGEIMARNKLRFTDGYSAPFEWRFLRRTLDEVESIPRVELPYICGRVVFSPNDDRLAIGHVNRSVTIVNVKEKRLVEVFGPADFMWHPAPGMAFVGPDDALAYSFGDGLNIHPHEQRTGSTAPILPGKIRMLAASRDGNHLALLDADRTVRVLRAKELTLLSRFALPGAARCRSIAWSPGELLLVVSCADEPISVWDGVSGKQVGVLPEQPKAGGVLAFSPDGRFLAAGSEDIVQILDWKEKRLLCSLRGHSDLVFALEFSPDGSLLASGSRDHTVILWSVPSFRIERTLRGHSAAVTGLAFSARGDVLATVGSDPEVLFWDVAGSYLPETISFDASDRVTNLAIAGDDRTLAAICGRDRFTFPEDSAASSREVLFWDLVSGASLPSLDTGHNVFSLAFDRDGRLATGGEDGQIDLWNWKKRSKIRSYGAHADIVRDLVFSPNGGLLASVSDDGTAKLWEVATSKQVPTAITHLGRVRAVAFSTDGSTLATGGFDRTIRLWNLQSRTLEQIPSGHSSDIVSLAFSAQAGQLASSSWDGTIRIWDLNNLSAEPRTLRGHSMWVSSIRFSNDGRTLFSSSGDWQVKIWDLDACQERFTLNGHTKGVNCMAISSDGTIIASGARDATIRLWRAPLR